MIVKTNWNKTPTTNLAQASWRPSKYHAARETGPSNLVPNPTGEYRGLGDLHDGEYAQGLRGSLTVEIVIIIKQLKAFIIVHCVFFM